MKRTTISRCLLSAAALAITGSLGAKGHAAAVSYTWGSSSSGNWSTNSKWVPASGSGYPGLDPGDSALGNGTNSGVVTTLDISPTIKVLSSGNNKTWTIDDNGSGNSITFSSGAFIQGTGSSTNTGRNLIVNVPVVATTSMTIRAINAKTGVQLNGALTGTGNLTVSSDLSGTSTQREPVKLAGVNVAGTVTVNGSNSSADNGESIQFNGVLGSNITSLTLHADNKNQVLMSGAANTYTGLTTVSGGTLRLAKTAGVNAIAGDLTIGDGTGTDTVTLTNANQIVDSSALTLNSSGVLNLNAKLETVSSLSAFTGATVATGGLTGILTVSSFSFNGSAQSAGIYTTATAPSGMNITGAGSVVVLIPEPASMAGVGLAGLALVARRRRRA